MPTLSTIGAACARAWGFTSGLVKDQYFNLVSLLLPSNGTNGAQNNTFQDSSSNSFPITRNPTSGPNAPTQGTFSPFSQTGWGAYFDGSNDYVATSANNLSMQFGTGSYTVECWIYQTARNSNGAFFIGGSGSIFQVNINATGYLEASLAGIGGFTASTSTVPLNSWTHIAVVRSSTSTNGCTYYINGNASGTYTDSNNHSSSISTINIGTTNAGSSTYVLSGYISNMRIAKSAYYTSNFTPSITPLTTTSQGATNVTLLSLQSNRFIDNAATPNTLTPNNGVAITPFSPFAPTAAYSAAAVGGSGYFDGTGDYLTVASNSAFTFTGDFTWEGWFYMTANPSKSYSTRLIDYNGGTNFVVFSTSDGSDYLGFIVAGSSYSTTTALPRNQWAHVAISRSGTSSNNLKMFLNGTAISTQTNTSTVTAADIYISNRPGSDGYFTGYIGSYRLTNTGVYTSNFTPPTSPATSASALLLNFTNAGVVDATAKNVLETVGNAQISTTQSKWGGGSVYFDGLNSYLLGASSQQYEFGSGDFTIEAWLNISAAPGDGGIITKGLTGTIDTKIWSLEFVGSGTYPNAVGWYVNAASASFIITGTTNLKSSTWTHVAVCKSGNNTRLFVNGQQEGSTYTTNYTIASGGSLYVGTSFYAPTTRDITGYIDDLRITKYARYVEGTGGNAGKMVFNGTNTLALPTAPFPVQ